MAMHGSHTRAGAWFDNVSMVAFILIPWLYDLSRLGRWSARVLFTTYGTLLLAYGVGYWFLGPDLGIGLDLFGLSIALWIISEAVYRWHSAPARALSGLVGFAVAAAFGITPVAMFEPPGEYWWVAAFWLPGALASNPAPGRRRHLPWFRLGMASFLSAYYIWLSGTADHPLCDPDSLIQAHAVWHLLGTAATWCFFQFFRTESATVD